VRLTNNFKLKAGFYPAVYSIDNEVFVKPAGYTELEYSPEPIFFKLRYNYRLENKRYRLETGYSFNKNYGLVLAINSNLNDDNTILTGLKYNF